MFDKLKKNWKTSVGGLVGSAGAAMATSDDPKVKMTGMLMLAFAISFLGYHAVDAGK